MLISHCRINITVHRYILELTNDILLNNVTGAQAYANYVTYAQIRRAAMRWR